MKYSETLVAFLNSITENENDKGKYEIVFEKFIKRLKELHCVKIDNNFKNQEYVNGFCDAICMVIENAEKD